MVVRLLAATFAVLGVLLAAAYIVGFAEIRGFLTEGRDRSEAVMRMTGAENFPALYSKVLGGAGMLAYRQADYDAAEKYFSESLRKRGTFWEKKARHFWFLFPSIRFSPLPRASA